MQQSPILKPNVLLAKSFESGRWKGSYSLVGHTADVVNAVTTLIDVLGDRLITQFALKCSLSELKVTARLAAYIHDWGKANHHFQLMVRGIRHSRHQPQLLRHEIVSMLLAWEYRRWLQESQGDFMTALVAAGGHHVKLGGKTGIQTNNIGEISESSGSDRIYLYTHPNYFRGLIRYGLKNLDLPRKVELFPQKLPYCWKIADIEAKQQEIFKAFLQWQPDPVFVAVVKALVVAGDTIGSALPRERVNIKQWIEQQLNNTLTRHDVQRIVKARLKESKPHQFQQDLENSKARVTIARAGCGTGKTAGAYMWIKQYAEGRRLFFGYPTTGTSTEGFLDYVHDKVDSELLHSRAAVDLEHLAQTGDDDDLATKLESFKAWSSKVTVCTVDTILGLLQCNKRSLYCFPAIAQSAFVFDEIHCYDDRLFGALIRFLEVVKAPILLMSASVLPSQLREIQAAVGEELAIISGEAKLEIKPRYRFQLADTPDWKRIERELNHNGKVLWVCNQVSTAISVYLEAKRRGLNPLLYHSRYRYEDRVRHHREVVDSFEQDCPILAITTQVAEMSLDLSATLLISQIANPASLIQRLGRLNRRHCGYALEAIFYRPKIKLPYSDRELADGLKMVQEFTEDVSQADLAEWLEMNDSEANRQPDKDTVLFDPSKNKKWHSYPSNCRQAGHTITVLLEIDTLPLRKVYCNSNRQPLLGLLLASSRLFLTYIIFSSVQNCPAKLLPRYTVPLLFTKDFKIKNPKILRYYPIAETKNYGYSSELGAYELKPER